MSSPVIVADHDPVSRSEIAHALAPHFTVIEAGDGMHALREVLSRQPFAIVTDFNLPLLGGLEFIRVMRGASALAIMVVNAKAGPETAVRALDAGADDYLVRPVSMLELLARTRAVIRRREWAPVAPQQDDGVVRTGSLAVRRGAHAVTLRGSPVSMTRTEHALLDVLAGRVGELCPHRYLLSAVWGSEYADDTHYLRGYVASLRAKIEDDPAAPQLLLTEWGAGYRLAALPPQADLAMCGDLRGEHGVRGARAARDAA